MTEGARAAVRAEGSPPYTCLLYTSMDRPLEPPNFVVDTLISQGLHILAGSPKVGKSWLSGKSMV